MRIHYLQYQYVIFSSKPGLKEALISSLFLKISLFYVLYVRKRDVYKIQYLHENLLSDTNSWPGGDLAPIENSACLLRAEESSGQEIINNCKYLVSVRSWVKILMLESESDFLSFAVRTKTSGGRLIFYCDTLGVFCTDDSG